METQIHWYQTINTMPIFLGIVVFILIILANVKNKRPHPWAKVIIPGSAVLFLVVAGMYSRADISAEKGTRFSESLMLWQEEAASLSGLDLRPEMKEMIAYLEKKNTGNIGELKDIRDHVSYETMSEPYLSYLQFQQFNTFVAACDKRSGASRSYEKAISGYPVSISEAKAYIHTLNNQGILTGDCNLAVPLIMLD